MTKEMIENFAATLQETLTRLCSNRGMMGERMGESLDFDMKWDNVFAKPYLADAVPEFNAFPDAALAWAAYLGMGAAQRWDMDFNRFKGDEYSFFLGSRGWDDMDEHILRDILKLPLASAGAAQVSDLLSACATAALDAIRHSGSEAGTADAYFVFVEAVRVMYRTGAAIQLFRMGYRMTPMSS